MRDLNPTSALQGHPVAGRNPPTPAVKAAKKAPGKKVPAKKAAAKKTAATGREPPIGAGAVMRRAAAIAALPAGSIPVVVTGIDFHSGQQVKVIISGREPPTGGP
jgi:hypothetical protein